MIQRLTCTYIHKSHVTHTCTHTYVRTFSIENPTKVDSGRKGNILYIHTFSVRLYKLLGHNALVGKHWLNII